MPARQRRDVVALVAVLALGPLAVALCARGAESFLTCWLASLLAMAGLALLLWPTRPARRIAREPGPTAPDQRRRELDQLKGQFLSNISHEIRTPISAMLAGAEMLHDPELSADERRSHLDALTSNGRHLLDLVNTLLDLSKIETGSLLVELVPCRPADVVQEVLSYLLPQAESKALELSSDLSPEAGDWVATDPARLRQILTHVVGNAVKFTERGGVHLSCRTFEDDGVRMLQMIVSDTGVGIPAEFLDRLFEPFTQADGSSTRRHGGTGLGLAVARRLARHLGGDIEAESPPGRGTRMTITIAAPPASPPADCGTDPLARRFAGRVLVVDDSLDNRRLISAMLRKAGVEVDVAQNGKDAIDRLATQQERGMAYDMVLMDVQMPEMDGLAATRWLREHHVQLPIVALTAHALAEDRERCLAAGCDAYETKPISRARLVAVLERHLRATGIG